MFKLKTKEQIDRILSQKENESLREIILIEKIIKNISQKGIEMPPPKTPVLLLFSGGIDSTTLLYLLVKKYKLIVYPFVNLTSETGLDHKNITLIYELITPLKNEYPSLVQDAFFFKHKLVPKEIKQQTIQAYKNNPELILKKSDQNNIFHQEIPDMMSQYLSPCLQYIDLIKIRENIDINYLFIGLVANDGDVVKSQTLTSIRSTNLTTILSTKNKSQFKIIPFFIERNFSLFMDKIDVIKMANVLGVPLEKTWSCYQNDYIQCGICLDCLIRKENLKKANVKDKTEYFHPVRGNKEMLIKQIKGILTKLKLVKVFFMN